LTYPRGEEGPRDMAPVAHTTHPDIVKRLKRVDGHLRNVIGMMESARPCMEIVQQLHAVERAVAAAKKTLIHDHIDHCLADAAEDETREPPKAIEEFKEITKYL
jgi:uncharacterized protein